MSDHFCTYCRDIARPNGLCLRCQCHQDEATKPLHHRIETLERELAEARAKSECGCQINRTGEEVLYTCEQHQYPSTEQEKRAMKDALAAAARSLQAELAALKGRTCSECVWALRHDGSSEWLCNLIQKPCFVVNHVCGAWAAKEGVNG